MRCCVAAVLMCGGVGGLVRRREGGREGINGRLGRGDASVVFRRVSRFYLFQCLPARDLRR